jgi:predicted RNA-binding protein with TRAM domain
MASSASNGGARTHHIRSNLEGLEDLFTFLVAIPEVLEDQDARIERLDERLEEGLETVEDLERAYGSLLSNLQETEDELDEQQAEIEALREEVDGLRDDLDALRGLYSDRVLDKEDAHINAQKRDATDIVNIGDTRTVVVNDTNYDDPRDPKAVARIEGLVTFVPAPEKDLTEGDEVEVRISDVGENHAHALRINE